MTQRDRIVVAVFATAAILAGFWFGVMKPKRAELADLQTQVAAQQERLTAARAQVVAGERARETFKEDYATVAELGKAVPADDEVPSLLYQLESTAERTNISFRSLKLREGGGAPAPPGTASTAAVAAPGSAIGSAGFPTMPFEFRFDGDFFRMERFLSALERNTSTFANSEEIVTRGRLITIDGIGLTASKLGGFPDVSASVAATTYMLPADEGATAGATPAGPGTAAGPGATPPPSSSTTVNNTSTASAGGVTK